jgi:hypothetical protein
MTEDEMIELSQFLRDKMLNSGFPDPANDFFIENEYERRSPVDFFMFMMQQFEVELKILDHRTYQNNIERINDNLSGENLVTGSSVEIDPAFARQIGVSSEVLLSEMPDLTAARTDLSEFIAQIEITPVSDPDEPTP